MFDYRWGSGDISRHAGTAQQPVGVVFIVYFKLLKRTLLYFGHPLSLFPILIVRNLRLQLVYRKILVTIPSCAMADSRQSPEYLYWWWVSYVELLVILVNGFITEPVTLPLSLLLHRRLLFLFLSACHDFVFRWSLLLMASINYNSLRPGWILFH